MRRMYTDKRIKELTGNVIATVEQGTRLPVNSEPFHEVEEIYCKYRTIHYSASGQSIYLDLQPVTWIPGIENRLTWKCGEYIVTGTYDDSEFKSDLVINSVPVIPLREKI